MEHSFFVLTGESPFRFIHPADLPIYAQIIAQIQQRIVTSQLQPGDRLPSVRDLAAEAGVNPNTMQRAMTELERQGLVHSQRTAGRFVTEDEATIRKLREDLARTSTGAYPHNEKPAGLPAGFFFLWFCMPHVGWASYSPLASPSGRGGFDRREKTERAAILRYCTVGRDSPSQPPSAPALPEGEPRGLFVRFH